MKRHLILFLFLTCNLQQGWSMGRNVPRGVSLLLVPAQPNLIQVARDLSDMGDALMMSYSPSAPADSPFLHIWDGSRWIPVAPEKFRSGTFLKNSASQLVVVGVENERTAYFIETALGWCPEVLHMETTQVTGLINQLGKVYGFSRSDWEWIAQRYQLQLEDLTRDLPRTSWYDTHTTEDVPVTPPPWKQKKQREQVPPPPTTSLTPVEESSEPYQLEME